MTPIDNHDHTPSLDDHITCPDKTSNLPAHNHTGGGSDTESGPDFNVHAPVHTFKWCRGEPPVHTNVFSPSELDHIDGADLVIITLPRDSPQRLPQFQQLYELFDIPREFISETIQSVTHSFGTRRQRDGTFASWMHLLSTLPFNEGETNSKWTRSGFLLISTPSHGANHSSIAFICFEPPPAFWPAVNRLYGSCDWEDILADPYLLLTMAFDSWYQLVDESAWKVLDLARASEQVVFEEAAVLEGQRFALLTINYNHIHALAKEALHLIEGVDAVLRSLACATQAHAQADVVDHTIWRAVQDTLQHRGEMFSSTRLRLASIDQRLKNCINLAFNIRTMRDSRVMQEDSYVMKSLALLGMIFLPISTVSSIFGTQFFGTVSGADVSTTGPSKPLTFVTSQFWIFWTIVIPIMMGLLLGWSFWIRRYRPSSRSARSLAADVEGRHATCPAFCGR